MGYNMPWDEHFQKWVRVLDNGVKEDSGARKATLISWVVMFDIGV